jgi:deoxyadenosine/deoxycytidine kinase
MLYDQGKIEDVNYQIYLNWFNEFVNDFPIDHYIYLQTDPTVCYNRIHVRARKGEELIPLEYLKTCNEYHDEFLKDNVKIVLDGNKDIVKTPEIIKEWIAVIDKIVNKYLE